MAAALEKVTQLLLRPLEKHLEPKRTGLSAPIVRLGGPLVGIGRSRRTAM